MGGTDPWHPTAVAASASLKVLGSGSRHDFIHTSIRVILLLLALSSLVFVEQLSLLPQAAKSTVHVSNRSLLGTNAGL
ncbi:hypothetical protein [Streptomyces californicus]|uniref:hypothetical protein n=1 Tax=Streptomyces californicus TaxID=67351 RepID=UPI0038266B9E